MLASVKHLATIILLSVICISAARAMDGLMISDLELRATAPSAGATAGYVTIHNHSETDDRLIGVEASFAGKAELHEMKLVGDVMKMRPLENGVAIPAGGMVTLKKGADHLMFMQLQEPINLDQSYEITLIFEKAGKKTLSAKTIPLGNKSSHKAQKHEHKH